MADQQWLKWAKELQAHAQTGLTYAENIFDRERFAAIQHIAVEIIVKHTSHSPQQIIDLFNHENGYPTAKLDVRGAVFKDNKILLVQERSDLRWALPGGWADVNYSPAKAVEKEISEESGYSAKAIKLIALYDYQKQQHPPDIRYIYKCFFLCELIGGEPTPSSETAAVGFFAEDELPPLSKERVMPHQIKRCFEHYRHPQWPTEFD